MLIRLTIVCAWLVFAASKLLAGSPLDFQLAITSLSHESLSGQFVVHDAPPAEDFLVGVNDSSNYVHLDPALVPVSCERIKQALLLELREHDQWHDKIIVDLHHAQRINENVIVSPARFANDWLYRVQMSDLMDRSQFVSAIVEVILLEKANRHTTQSTEIPTWLVEGLARQIELSSQTELFVEPPTRNANGTLFRYSFYSNRRTNPLSRAHDELHSLPPLTIGQLSWPADWNFTGASGEEYRSSAQLFVDALLQFNDGRECLQSFIAGLPQHLNWQMAFLHAFHSHFANQLDLDKWWALRIVQFTGRDLAQTWPANESWDKLDEILRPIVEVRSGPNTPPRRNQISLETIINDWDVPAQKKVLREKSQQLTILRVSISQDLVQLVDDYRRVLNEYLSRKDNTVYVTLGKTLYPRQIDTYARDAIRQLAELDARRAQLRPKPQPAQPIASSTPAQ